MGREEAGAGDAGAPFVPWWGETWGEKLSAASEPNLDILWFQKQFEQMYPPKLKAAASVLIKPFATIGAAMLLISCAEMRPIPDSSGFETDDFITSSKAVSLGKNMVQVTLEIRNPTHEPICIYEGMLHLADLVSARNPDRVLIGLEDDPHEADPKHLIEGRLGDGPIFHDQMGLSQQKGPFRPDIRIGPGDHYSFTQNRDYGKYVVLYGDALDGVGFDYFSAVDGRYRIAFRGLQVFRCALLDDAMMERVSSEVLSFSNSHLPISLDNPGGLFWRYADVVLSEEFTLDLVPPPKAWQLTYVEVGL